MHFCINWTSILTSYSDLWPKYSKFWMKKVGNGNKILSNSKQYYSIKNYPNFKLQVQLTRKFTKPPTLVPTPDQDCNIKRTLVLVVPYHSWHHTILPQWLHLNMLYKISLNWNLKRKKKEWRIYIYNWQRRQKITLRTLWTPNEPKWTLRNP